LIEEMIAEFKCDPLSSSYWSACLQSCQ